MASYKVVGSEVREMFGSIAHKYDAANSALSFGIHHLWRRALLRLYSIPRTARVLDLCTGTGDLLKPLRDRADHVVGCDFCQPMLDKAAVKLEKWGIRDVPLVQADAHNLPFKDGEFDVVTVAFGVRNFENIGRALSEIRRVLAPGGRLLVLEFGQPKVFPFSTAYAFYSRHILPLFGGMVTGNTAAYAYLERTSSAFPCGGAFEEILRQNGFHRTKGYPLLFGLVYRYLAEKTGADSL